MSSLDPELLRAFVAVAERLSFTRAAEQLNRTQAAISLQVKRLEERLEVALFRRSTAHVELTAAGEDFLVDARRILVLNEQAIARVSNQRVAGRIRIGVMEDYGTKILPRLLADIAARFPLMQVEMEIGLTARLLKRLGSSFDAVLAMHPEGTAEGDLICRERAIWAAAAAHPVEELDPLPVALSDPDCLFRSWAVRALDKAGRPWRLAYVSPSLAATEAIVEQGLAITVVKGSMLTPGLRAVHSGRHVPVLPGAEIRLHRAATSSASAALVVDHLAHRLRLSTLGS
ncbi:LysR substrate-binding domain-containing protein [Mesorhizobium sp. B2-3-4]|uniref:LysR substrate-binding domain-containing protein n=1 Tax=Mesorhizobium sp. B2-3-4 TaxID=2589959 RepID=UPI00112862A3|nr:LysR substrate-binding domain-containing protein [Mesorhizobium sp. B2-3-4]TPM39410.1 LysR family transcriptional regulator [Mesorhizobium sp. B2-3-4]